MALVVKNPTPNAGNYETEVRSLGREDPLEKGMATHSSVLAWRLPWTDEPVHDRSKLACTRIQQTGKRFKYTFTKQDICV